MDNVERSMPRHSVGHHGRWPCSGGGGGRPLVFGWENAVNNSFLHKGTGIKYLATDIGFSPRCQKRHRLDTDNFS